MAKQKHIHIVKRQGHFEVFDQKKIYASVYASCLAGQFPKTKCEAMAEVVTNQIKKWVDNREEISSEEIFKQVVKFLKKEDKGIAFLYETHRDVS